MTDISTERRAIELFEALLGIDEAERDAWIAKATRGDKALAQRLDSRPRGCAGWPG